MREIERQSKAPTSKHADPLPILEFFRYGLASLAALVVDFALLAFFTEIIGLHYLISGAIGFTAGLVLIYLLSIGWVFRRRKMDNWHKEWILFAVIGLVGLLINEFGLWVLTEKLHIHYLVSKLGASVAVFLWNFSARKYFLFS